METQQLSLTEHLKRVIRRYRFVILSIIAVSIGVGLVLYSHLTPSTSILENVAKDIGLALFTTGIIGLALEYYTREQFLEDMADTMTNVMKTSPLDSKLDLLRDQVHRGIDLHSLGVSKIYRDRSLTDLTDLDRYLEEAEPGSEIKLLGISLTTFSNARTLLVIDKKLKEGCKVKMLILDPESEIVRQRAAEEGQDYEGLRTDIVAAKNFYSNLIRRLPADLRQNVEIRHYVSAPTNFILCTNSTMLVSPYLSGRRGFDCPHLELEIKEGGIYLPFLDHFDYLWNVSKGSKGV